MSASGCLTSESELAAVLRGAFASLRLLRARAEIAEAPQPTAALILRSLARRARRLEGWPRTSRMKINVIYARGRHQWMSNDIYEIFVIYVSSVADTTQR
jgi:hypothetical protein